MLPLAAAGGAALVYLASRWEAGALWGGVAAAAALLVIVLLFGPPSRVETANARTYGALYGELLEVDARLDIGAHRAVASCAPAGGLPGSTTTGAGIAPTDLRASARSEAIMFRNAFVTAMMKADDPARWVTGTGYVDLWNDIHHAEEALVLFEPLDLVLSDARHDRLRLQGALMDQGPDLLTELDQAVNTLTCARSPAGSMRAALGRVRAAAAGILPAGDRTGRHPSGPSRCDEMGARVKLRDVRREINTFRDDNRDGIVRARAQLLETVFVLGILLCILVSLAIMLSVTQWIFDNALWVYVVGVAVGLFNRLYVDSTADTVVDDFGLARARLIALLVFSGLAAVGGVLVMSIVSNVTVPPQGRTGTWLGVVFDLIAHPSNVLVAAVFGLTPSLLISALQQQTTKYANNIKSSNATTPKQPPWSRS
jgi:hypothetical protein